MPTKFEPIVPTKTMPASVSASNTSAALLAAALGLALIVAAGFAETQVLHNTAHDARHSAGFPCH